MKDTTILCLEGITGAGKTTQAQFIEEYLSSANKSYLTINEKKFEPFRSAVVEWHGNGQNLYFTRTQTHALAKARGETHKQHFLPLMGHLDYLIFDRSFYTSAVYQADGELSLEEIISINLEKGAIGIDKGVILLCPPEIAFGRTESRRRKFTTYTLPSLHENYLEIEKRRNLYLELAKLHPELRVVNTERSEQVIFEDIKVHLNI